MRKSYRIFLQAFVLSFLGHAMFFSLFNVQDIEFERKGLLLPMTILQMGSSAQGRVETTTSSNPELIDPKLVHLAEKAKRMTSPKLESHRKAIVWEAEMTAKTFEPDVLSWLTRNFRRTMPYYDAMFENPALFASPSNSGTGNEETEKNIEPDTIRMNEIQTSFSGRRLLQSSLPALPDDMLISSIPSVRLKIGVSSDGMVRFALPESGIGSMLETIASNEVRKWRFSPKEGFEDIESAENIEWGWVTVPFEKATTSVIIEENGGKEGTGAGEQ